MSCQHSRSTLPRALLATFATLPFLFPTQAWAAPHSYLVRRDSSSSGGGSSKIVAPVIAALVFLVAVPMIFYRDTVLSKLRHVTFRSMLGRRQAPTTAVRDLTAEEIAGTAATDQANAATATRTERRPRRNRRTPSQISTRSLPTYMKEPGEHELVIIQGSQDMEDAPLTAQVVMPPVTEDESESANSHSRSHSHNPSQVSSYAVNDEPHVQTPLLQTDELDENTHEHENSYPHVPPGTVDISDLQYNDPSSSLPGNPRLTDPRGEAPPYFEVVGGPFDVGAMSGDLARVDTTDTLPIAPDTPPGTPPARRRSMFRGLIHAASRALSTPHSSAYPTSISRPSRPSRDVAASPSPRPSNLSNRPAGSRSPLIGHRTTPSNSGSILSVTSSAFGARSRSAINVLGGLTSPSALSMTSISAPLTHTAVRTDFVYPRSGPTPEQLKLISSVESVSKFGVPYGPDAIAYASASLVNLHGPPPEFEERSSIDGLPGPSVAPTRARARSSLSRQSQDGNAPELRLSTSSPPSAASSRVTTVTSASATDEPEAAASHPRLEASTLSDIASAAELEGADEKEKPEEDHPVEGVHPRSPSPSPTQATTSTAATVIKATTSELGAASESLDEKTSGSNQPALTAVTRNITAPSSFRMPSALQGQSHAPSRSSSIDTFRTATSKFEQARGLEHRTSDTEHETDTFTDAESGAETEAETPPVTPYAVSVGSRGLGHEQPALSI